MDRGMEGLTFRDSGLDRAAHLRARPEAMAAALADPAARMLPLWRGKPLLEGEALAWLATDHPALDPALPPVFLGLDGGAPRFACDLSRWAPDAASGDGGLLDTTEQRHPDLPGLRFAELRSVMAALTAREGELAAIAKAVTGWHGTHGFCARCGAASDPVQAGWMRTCPACFAQHFPRTDPVAIMLVTRGNAVLVGRSPGWPEGMYSCLAGFVEPGETPEAAVRREVFEESGVRVGPVRYVAAQPWPWPGSLMLGFHAEAETTEINVDPAELEDALWLSREDLATALRGEHPRVRPPRGGAIAGWMLRRWLEDRVD